MNNKKFRVWDNIQNKFEYFDLNSITVPDRLLSQHSYPVQQFLGILDKNMKEVYEEDVVQFKTDFKADIGVVRYMNDYCSYVVEVEGDLNLNNTPITSLPKNLKVGGNLYLYDTKITFLPDCLDARKVFLDCSRNIV